MGKRARDRAKGYCAGAGNTRDINGVGIGVCERPHGAGGGQRGNIIIYVVECEAARADECKRGGDYRTGLREGAREQFNGECATRGEARDGESVCFGD